MFQNRIQIHTTDDEQRRRSKECTERRIGDVKREKAHRQSIETEWGGTCGTQGRFKSQIAVVRREAKAHVENETGSG